MMCETMCGRRYLCIPDVHAFVEGATGEVTAIGAECDAVDGLLVPR